MIIFAIDQRSAEWVKVRAGLVTGSCAGAILAERKRGTGELKERANLRARVVCERLTGIVEDDLPYLPFWMRHGVETESAAFAAYEAAVGVLAERVGFVAHYALAAGCSPDGVVNVTRDEFSDEVIGIEGVIELKCPKAMTHLSYLKGNDVPEEYAPQVLHSLWITGAQWCDFCSFHPGFPEHQQLFRVRVPRDEGKVAAYELMVRLFLSECEKELDAARQLGAVPA